MAKLVNPALFIGLGGTGHKVLLQLKKSILTNYGEMPPQIDMLCFDTDKGELLSAKQNLTYTNKNGEIVNESITFDQDEVYEISIKNPAGLLKFPFMKEWLSPLIIPKIKISSSGANQIRQLGRFAIFQNDPDNIIEKINRKINILSDINIERYPEYKSIGKVAVHLVFSPCGGTGAGTFIDMVMNLRKLNPEMSINAYMVMPEFYTSLGATKDVVKNFYASLIEIDHLM